MNIKLKDILTNFHLFVLLTIELKYSLLLVCFILYWFYDWASTIWNIIIVLDIPYYIIQFLLREYSFYFDCLNALLDFKLILMLKFNPTLLKLKLYQFLCLLQILSFKIKYPIFLHLFLLILLFYGISLYVKFINKLESFYMFLFDYKPLLIRTAKYYCKIGLKFTYTTHLEFPVTLITQSLKLYFHEWITFYFPKFKFSIKPNFYHFFKLFRVYFPLKFHINYVYVTLNALEFWSEKIIQWIILTLAYKSLSYLDISTYDTILIFSTCIWMYKYKIYTLERIFKIYLLTVITCYLNPKLFELFIYMLIINILLFKYYYNIIKYFLIKYACFENFQILFALFKKLLIILVTCFALLYYIENYYLWLFLLALTFALGQIFIKISKELMIYYRVIYYAKRLQLKSRKIQTIKPKSFKKKVLTYLCILHGFLIFMSLGEQEVSTLELPAILIKTCISIYFFIKFNTII